MAIATFPIQLDEKGVAYLEGATTKVIEIVQAKQAHGWTPEEVKVQLPHLTLAQVYAALAYYHINKTALDRQIQEREEWSDAVRAQQTNPFTRAELVERQKQGL